MPRIKDDARMTRRAQNRGQVDALDIELQDQEIMERKARLKAFSERWQNSAMPQFPKDMIPGYHLCWVGTDNSRDTPEGRMPLGYTFVSTDEIPEEFRGGLVAGDKMTQSKYGSAVIAGSLVLMKLPNELYEEVMTTFHHEEPLEFHRDMIENAQNMASSHRGGKVTIDEGMSAEAAKLKLKPSFS